VSQKKNEILEARFF
jgi:hypothetical protein